MYWAWVFDDNAEIVSDKLFNDMSSAKAWLNEQGSVSEAVIS